MTISDLSLAVIHTAHQIDKLRQKLEESADLKEKRRLQLQLKELQILQLWQLSQAENAKGRNQVDDDLLERLGAEFAAALIENDDMISIAQVWVDQIKIFLDAGDLDGLRRWTEQELKKLEKRNPGN